MKQTSMRIRRVLAVIGTLVLAGFLLYEAELTLPSGATLDVAEVAERYEGDASELALVVLEELEVKGRAPRTDYARSQFGSGWGSLEGCDLRNTILFRDLKEVKLDTQCRVVSGVLHDPYTAETIQFERSPEGSRAVQIDHVVALSDAWQKGAQALSYERRVEFSNDPLNLLAVDGPANQQKGDGDAATWLPANRSFRCQYVARQVGVKHAYSLWVTRAEKEAIERVLTSCPEQLVPVK